MIEKAEMEAIESKTFEDLKQQVLARSACSQCGGCVSFCSAGDLNVLEMGADGYPRYVDEEKCLHCGICYLVCPEIMDLDAELRQDFNWKPPIGAYQTVVSARSTDKEVQKVATDGGVVTSLLIYMLENKMINGALVAKKVGPFQRIPTIAQSPEQLIAAAGFHFSPPQHLEHLGDKYCTYSPTLSTIKEIGDTTHVHLALVGTPCQVNTLRKMQMLKVVPSQTIKFTLGLFCMGHFSIEGLMESEKIQKKIGASLDAAVKLNVKENVIITLERGRTVHLPMEEMEEFIRPACLVCREFANDLADISVGGLASPTGYTTTLVRTNKGREIYRKALMANYIEELSGRVQREEQLAKIISFAHYKNQRAKHKRNQAALKEFR